MNIKNNIRAVATAMLVGLSFPSCSDWLDVAMEDKIMENVLFDQYQGYVAALNGVYTGMNNIYSSNLAAGYLDVMAQYYYIDEISNSSKQIYSNYKYTDSNFQSFTNTIWSRIYTLLANTNVILEHTEGNPEVLTEAQCGLIRGEAFALRAFFHFDLLRLYGPVFSLNSTAECIPYQSSSARDIQPFLPANEVLDLIIADLKSAEELLAKYDTILTNGVQNVTVEDDGVSSYDLAFRQLRLNYYAVELMLARAYLWKGDKTEAYNYAKKNIIDKITTDDLEVFPWVQRSAIDATDNPDFVFSSEVIFSIYNSQRVDDVYRALFNKTLNRNSRLTFRGTDISGNSKVATFYDDPNDIRIKMWEVVEPTDSELKEAAEQGKAAENSLAFNKYQDIANSTLDRYMVPLMRLSEAYLIAAECAPSATEALGYINTIRLHRECPNYPDTYDVDKALLYETAREMIGEGQLFYFYKRRNATQMISGTSLTDMYEVSSSEIYTIPVPDAEMEKRGSLED